MKTSTVFIFDKSYNDYDFVYDKSKIDIIYIDDNSLYNITDNYLRNNVNSKYIFFIYPTFNITNDILKNIGDYREDNQIGILNHDTNNIVIKKEILYDFCASIEKFIHKHQLNIFVESYIRFNNHVAHVDLTSNRIDNLTKPHFNGCFIIKSDDYKCIYYNIIYLTNFYENPKIFIVSSRKFSQNLIKNFDLYHNISSLINDIKHIYDNFCLIHNSIIESPLNEEHDMVYNKNYICITTNDYINIVQNMGVLNDLYINEYIYVKYLIYYKYDEMYIQNVIDDFDIPITVKREFYDYVTVFFYKLNMTKISNKEFEILNFNDIIYDGIINKLSENYEV